MEFMIDEYFPAGSTVAAAAGLDGFEEQRPLYLAGCKEFLNHYREQIRGLHDAGASGSVVTHLLCQMMDHLVRKLYCCVMTAADPGQTMASGGGDSAATTRRGPRARTQSGANGPS